MVHIDPHGVGIILHRVDEIFFGEMGVDARAYSGLFFGVAKFFPEGSTLWFFNGNCDPVPEPQLG